MTDLTRERLAEPGAATTGLRTQSDSGGSVRRSLGLNPFDAGSLLLLAAVTVLVLVTFRDYAITNDEWIQHRYGELIIAYYKSGFADRAVFALDNLYLYGGLFDVVAVLLSGVTALDAFDLRHLMSALCGVAGIGATIAAARLLAGPRAGLLAGIALAVCGSWYGTMFHHTKDVPLGAAMIGALYFLLRCARDLPTPRWRDVAGFGVLTGMALGIKVLGLLLVCYVGVAILLNIPFGAGVSLTAHARFVARALLRFAPGLLIAYGIMIVTWPWAALAPLNPVRGLFSFAAFHYDIATVLGGKLYRMATVPRWYVPNYIAIKIPLLMFAGALLGLAIAAWPRLSGYCLSPRRRRDIGLIAAATFFPVLCEVVVAGPAFCGMRHFLFVLPPLAVLAGVGLASAVAGAQRWRSPAGSLIFAAIIAGFAWNALTLVRLHPYQYIAYNPLVGGLSGAYRNYVTDYWFTTMPAALDRLELYLARTEPAHQRDAASTYTVGVCGEKPAFVKRAPSHLHWTSDWRTADFLLTPTHMNCDTNGRGRIVATVERLGVTLAVVWDQRLAALPGP